MTRVIVFSLVGFLLITLLGPIQSLLGIYTVVVDVPLIFVLYLVFGGRGFSAMRNLSRLSLFRGGIDWSGGSTGLILGYITDVLGGGVKGVHCLSISLMFLLCLWAARHVFFAGNISVIVVTFVASIIAGTIGVCIRWFISITPSLNTLTIVIYQAALCAAVAPVIMRLLRYLDSKLASDPNERGTLCQ